MKITETIERECCKWPDDLKDYFGKRPEGFPSAGGSKGKIWFCKHCGQLWHMDRALGEMDYGLEQLIIAWEP
jgi:hypothetical protein